MTYNSHTRRDCTEIRGIPLPEEPLKEDTNDIVIQLSEKTGVPMEEKISQLAIESQVRETRWNLLLLSGL